MHPAPVKKVITRKDLEKIDIRVGTILTVSNVPKSKKLVALLGYIPGIVHAVWVVAKKK